MARASTSGSADVARRGRLPIRVALAVIGCASLAFWAAIIGLLVHFAA
jgi:hypothetical protein